MPWSKEELFEVIDKKGKAVGLEKRETVHRKGLRHKGVYLAIKDDRGRIFLQQRAKDKDLMPLRWDFSVAEHLQPGESYRNACQRGGEEELGIKVQNPVFLGEVEFHFKYPGGEIDKEMNQAFASGFSGKIRFKDREVQAGKWVGKEELLQGMRENPKKFTPWLLQCKRVIEKL